MCKSESILSKENLLAILLIVLVVAIAYWPSLQNDFVNWDDDVHLLSNPFLTSLSFDSIRDIFTTTINKIYVPLTSLTFAIEHSFFGFNPFVYHLNNLLLHLLTTILVFLFFQKINISCEASLIGALVFGVHPMHVESVAWVTERKDVLCAVFYMLSLFAYLNYLKVDERGGSKTFFSSQYVLVIVLSLLSVLAKPMALSLFFIFFILDYLTQRRISKKIIIDKIPIVAVIVPVVWITYVLQMRVPSSEFPHSVLMWFWCLVFYLQKFIFPDYFSLFYEIPRSITLWPLAIVSSIFIGLFLFRRNKFILASSGFFFMSIFFLLRMDASADANVVADRFIYIPSIGLCMLIGVFSEMFLRKNQFLRRAFVVIFVLIIFILAKKTYQQCFVWRDSVSLWENQLKYNPKVITALTYKKLADGKKAKLQGEQLFESAEEIIELYEEAIRIKPDFANAYYELGRLYSHLGDKYLAMVFYQETLKYDETHFDAYYQLGVLAVESGEMDMAEKYFQQADQVRKFLD